MVLNLLQIPNSLLFSTFRIKDYFSIARVTYLEQWFISMQENNFFIKT